MRIAISNPDTMGDLVLRQPLYQALKESGHELLVLARPEFFPVIKYIAPSAATLAIPINPYNPGPKSSHDKAMKLLSQSVAAWQPHVLAFASWQWTSFEEWLSSELPELPVIGLTGRRVGDAAGESRQAFAQRIEAGAGLHELEKNRRLASAFGATISADKTPSILPPSESLEAASRLLEHVGLESGKYWIAAVGESSDRFSKLRNWTHEHWAAVLTHGARVHGWRYLLVGTPDEFPAMRAIRELAGSPAEIVMQDQPIEIDTLIGLTALSQGYVGRDTGPMHLAAALDRPILALFGGGTWPRFIPVAKAAIVLTVDVACAGCNWNCQFSESFCIKGISPGDVISAMDDLVTNDVKGVQIRMLPQSASISAKIGREAIIHLQTDRVLQSSLRAEVERSRLELEQLKARTEQLRDIAKGLENELYQYHMLVDGLKASKWRKLGRALGIVSPIETEMIS